MDRFIGRSFRENYRGRATLAAPLWQARLPHRYRQQGWYDRVCPGYDEAGVIASAPII